MSEESRRIRRLEERLLELEDYKVDDLIKRIEELERKELEVERLSPVVDWPWQPEP